jgi:hypothetical protein
MFELVEWMGVKLIEAVTEARLVIRVQCAISYEA